MSDKDDGSFSLSRRKALAGLAGIGGATALGGAATFAQFTDTESEEITFTAGGVDGMVEAGARYNGTVLQDFSGDDFTSEDDIENVGYDDSGGLGLNVTFEDVKPGDYGCFAFKLTVTNNPAWVAACLGYKNDVDGESFEPEAEVDSDYGEEGYSDGDTPGELAENILTIPFYKGASAPSSGGKFDPCIFFDEETETFNYENYKGSQAVNTPTNFWDNSEEGLLPHTLQDASTMQGLDTQAWGDDMDPMTYNVEDSIAVGDGCVFLNGDNPSNENQQGAAPLQPGDEIWMGWDWHLPFDTGNVVQGDQITLQLGFNFGQTRHTENAKLSNIYSPGSNTPNDD